MTTVLVLGGVRSGKSAYAERLLQGRDQVVYVAAGPAPSSADPDWLARVRAHRNRRPATWLTVEAGPGRHPGIGGTNSLLDSAPCPAPPAAAASTGPGAAARGVDLPALVAGLEPSAAALVDCLGTWVTRLIDDAGAWEDRTRVEALLAGQTERLVQALRSGRGDVVLVSNETGLGVVPASASGRLVRDRLGRLNATVAAACDHTVLVVAGRVLDLTATPTIDAASTFGLSGSVGARLEHSGKSSAADAGI
ncbi:MAG: bifunctional adenosylcobinamide kinase/adenosylcobinamide-phosphate guanylyltransferase, partial [Micrococcales bacterium]|nr:bifunctional adenosylcobinamide kinase/adenosylcobinamide-phosphate guanylyltransferase [Micrococcales bacterium]